MTRTSTHTPEDTEFRGHKAFKPNDFYDKHHTLTRDITLAHVKCLAAVCARLKETKRTRYSIITLQILLRLLVISVCGYNPLCNQLPFDKYLQFDRALHAKYIKDTKDTVTQPAHAKFLSRDPHGLHMPSLHLKQLQGRVRELDIRLNLSDSAQQGYFLARLAVMDATSYQHCNLIRDAIVSLAQYGLHFRNADEPIITNTLQLLLHKQPDRILLGQSHSNGCADSNSQFTIVGNRLEHTPYFHNHKLHQWLKTTTHHTTARVIDNRPPPPLLYEIA